MRHVEHAVAVKLPPIARWPRSVLLPDLSHARFVRRNRRHDIRRQFDATRPRCRARGAQVKQRHQVTDCRVLTTPRYRYAARHAAGHTIAEQRSFGCHSRTNVDRRVVLMARRQLPRALGRIAEHCRELSRLIPQNNDGCGRSCPTNDRIRYRRGTPLRPDRDSGNNASSKQQYPTANQFAPWRHRVGSRIKQRRQLHHPRRL